MQKLREKLIWGFSNHVCCNDPYHMHKTPINTKPPDEHCGIACNICPEPGRSRKGRARQVCYRNGLLLWDPVAASRSHKTAITKAGVRSSRAGLMVGVKYWFWKDPSSKVWGQKRKIRREQWEAVIQTLGDEGGNAIGDSKHGNKKNKGNAEGKTRENDPHCLGEKKGKWVSFTQIFCSFCPNLRVEAGGTKGGGAAWNGEE